MEIIQATTAELDGLISFYQVVADHMEERAIRQWHWGRYPNEELIRKDVEAGRLYYLPEDGEIAAAVVVMTGQDPEYEALSWNCGICPGVFHRLTVHPSMQGAGLGGLVLDDVQQMLRRSGCDCIRCDASAKTRGAIRLYEKMGFRLCDHMRWPDSPDNYFVYDKPLKRLAAHGHDDHLPRRFRGRGQLFQVLFRPVDGALVAQARQIGVIRRRKGGAEIFRYVHSAPPHCRMTWAMKSASFAGVMAPTQAPRSARAWPTVRS